MNFIITATMFYVFLILLLDTVVILKQKYKDRGNK